MFGHEATSGIRTGLLQTATCNLVTRFPVKKVKPTTKPTSKRR